MATARININPDVVRYYIQASNTRLDDLASDAQLKNVSQWLDSSAKPTFNQLNKLSKKIRVPFGYLLLNEVQPESTSLVDYRTIINNEIAQPSKELLETINDMEEKQNWMRDYLIRYEHQKLPFVGKYAHVKRVETIVGAIREALEIEEDWFNCCKSGNSFNYLRGKFERAGILVMQNGVVKSNTHRPLNIDEFRAFVLVDDYAPLIFINSTDSTNGKVFSLFHEAAHIFLGENDLLNDNHTKNPVYRNDLEILCNSIASELCLPIQHFEKIWNADKDRSEIHKIITISQQCKVSMLVVALKALKKNYIDEAVYNEVRKQSLQHYKKEKERKSENAGGNGLNTAVSKIDRRFFQLLERFED